MLYKLQLMDTQSGVGCFAAMPGPNLSFSEMVAQLRATPLDDYLHEFALQVLGKHRPRKVEKLIVECVRDNGQSDPVLTTLLFEACISHERLAKYLPMFKDIDPRELVQHSPSIHMRSHLLEDQPLHRKWISLFRNNIFHHQPLLSPQEAEIEPLDLPQPRQTEPTTVKTIRQRLADKLPPAKERKPLEETIAYALDALGKADAFLGPAMAHKAALSPVSRLRHWSFTTKTSNGRHSNTLQGMQTSYGRGLNEQQATASYSMEMAERFSSYANIGSRGILGCKNEYPLTHAAYEELDQPALDPASLGLEVPYQGQKLWWMPGTAPDQNGTPAPMLIPVQFAYLFCNCDEQSLFSALGSTGLASGNTLAEAKVSGLLEAVERDCAATTPFDLKRCFRIASDDPEISKLLGNYMLSGIHVWFMDMTPETGIPCYKAIVTGQRGDINTGTGADLSGKRALISAMTETPYPFPGPPSAPAPADLPTRKLEDLPDHATGSADGDLMVLEHTLTANGYTPCYADLTRKDLDIPVVRALIPGLEIISDFDQFSRVSPRLYANYLSMVD